MKYFFISYSHPKGFGNAYLSIDNFFIKTKVKEALEEINNCKGIVILYYHEVTEQEYEANK